MKYWSLRGRKSRSRTELPFIYLHRNLFISLKVQLEVQFFYWWSNWTFLSEACLAFLCSITFYDLFYFTQACNILPFQPTSFLNVGTLIADGSWHYLQQCQTSDSSISCLTCPEWCIKVHSGALNSTPGARAVLWMTCMHFTLCEEISHAIVWIAIQIICPPCDWPGLGLQQGYCYHMICLN